MNTRTATAAAKRPPALLLPVAATLDEAAGNLLRFGYTRLWRTTPLRVPALIEDFAKITRDPRRNRLVISADREKHQDGTNDLGLREVRRGDVKMNPRPDEVAEGRTRYDETKFVLHFNERALGYWRDADEFLREYGKFFFELSLLQGECQVLGLGLAERLDRLLPGLNFLQRMLEEQYRNRLRLLRYLCDGIEPGIAQRHRDQDFLTIQIRSDRGGLWLADRYNEGVISDVQETRDDSVLIFFGRKAWEISRGMIQGIVHGVLDPAFGQENRTPRHTVVSFLHAAVYSEEKRWSQEHMQQLSIPAHISNFGIAQAAPA